VLEKNTLVTDGVVRVGPSLFPAHVTVDSNGVGSARFLLIAHPEGGWVAGSWYANPAGGEPIMQVLERVTEIHQYTGRRIHMSLESGQQIVVTPGKGCACGSNLRMYNPFGVQTPLSSVPGPEVTR